MQEPVLERTARTLDALEYNPNPKTHSSTRVDDLMADVFGELTDTVKTLIVTNTPAEQVSIQSIIELVMRTFGIDQTAALALLDTTPAQVESNTTANSDIADRCVTAIEVFVRVSSKMGEEKAKFWFNSPKKGFDGIKPIDLLRTRTGTKQLEDRIDALEDGSFL